MRTPTPEELRRDPELRAALVRAAHRQRNEAMAQFFLWLAGRLKRKPAPARAAHSLAIRGR
jgi:hypothetical protein